MRLWHAGGQFRLEQASVCVISGNATAAEILKNLVLPGVGSFAILDHRDVSNADLAGNFFLEQSDISTNVAAAMCAHLRELNSDVRGRAVEERLETLLPQNDFWLGFDVVVVCGALSLVEQATLQSLLWQHNVALLRVWTRGFYGAVRIARRETTVFETHNPSPTYDLRLDCPWPELVTYADLFALEKLDDIEYAHVPYVVIYLKAIDQWRRAHRRTPPELPRTHAEKTDFRRNFVDKMARDISHEANFAEASQAIHRALQPTAVPESLQRLFSRKETDDALLARSVSVFWVYVRALADFVRENGGFLPLPGVLPDMVSTTSSYVRLQRIYREKALLDKQQFTAIVTALCERLQLDLQPDPESISTFCKNAAYLYVSNGAQLDTHAKLAEEFAKTSGLREDPRLLLVVYFGMLALDRWTEEGGVGGETQFLEVFSCITGASTRSLPKAVADTLRELFVHNVSGYANTCSYMGGIVAQEVLKIVTCQYIPLDNLYVFDGIWSVSDKWKAGTE